MSELHYDVCRHARARPQTDHRASAAEVCTEVLGASREAVLRELLDEAHARIRALEAALQRINAVR